MIFCFVATNVANVGTFAAMCHSTGVTSKLLATSAGYDERELGITVQNFNSRFHNRRLIDLNEVELDQLAEDVVKMCGLAKQVLVDSQVCLQNLF